LRTVRRSASGYDGPLYLYDGLPPRTTVHLQLRRSVVSVRRFCARYGDLPPAATVRRTLTTVCLHVRRFISSYGGPSYRYDGL